MRENGEHKRIVNSDADTFDLKTVFDRRFKAQQVESETFEKGQVFGLKANASTGVVFIEGKV